MAGLGLEKEVAHWGKTKSGGMVCGDGNIQVYGNERGETFTFGLFISV
jgi:hypothetical protein